MDRKVESPEGPVKANPAQGEKGSALVIALFVLALISVFVAFTLTRTAAEAAAVGNETAEPSPLRGAGSQSDDRNFNKVFERN